MDIVSFKPSSLPTGTMEERLIGHTRYFEGLMSLIPAKLYYGEDTSDQWKRKKQTKEEARQAKMAKLDPDSFVSAKDVLDMRKKSAKEALELSKKRKRDEDSASDVEGIEMEKPREGMKDPERKKNKKSKKENHIPVEEADKVDGPGHGPEPSKTDDNAAALESSKAREERKRQKRERKQAKQAKKEAKKHAQQALEIGVDTITNEDGLSLEGFDGDSAAKQHHGITATKRNKKSTVADTAEEEHDGVMTTKRNKKSTVGSSTERKQDSVTTKHYKGGVIDDSAEEEQDIATTTKQNKKGITTEDVQPQPQSSVTPTPAPESPTFDRSIGQSAASSTSSIVAAPTQEKLKKPLVDSETLRSRLQARIEALRAARMADSPDGTRARNRQELMEARRRKEEQRRAHKREVRQKAKEEELAKQRNPLQTRSPSVQASLHNPATEAENHLSFGRIAFADGQQVDTSLSTVVDTRPRKGPQDALGALKAAESKRSRLNGLDEQKRKDIEEKDLWLNAKKRIHGEKVRDDVSLLKKTLKRQEKGKHRSEAEWQERLEGVEKGKEMRQKKREENLRKRKDDKGGGGGVGKGKKKTLKKQKRPGFEGTFRSRPGPKDKNF